MLPLLYHAAREDALAARLAGHAERIPIRLREQQRDGRFQAGLRAFIECQESESVLFSPGQNELTVASLFGKNGLTAISPHWCGR